MRNLFGFFLFFAGLAFGAFAFYPEAIDRESHLAEITAILAAPAGDISRRTPLTTGSIRTFSPRFALELDDAQPAAQPTIPAEVSRDVAQLAMPPPPPAPIARTAGWQAVVKPEAGVPVGVKSSKPGDGHARYELVLDIQKELKRNGCYGGTLSGSWNAVTKRAMEAFMARANATLPFEEPDYILLTLVKGHSSASCVTCPLGQTRSEGQCVPKAIIARAVKKSPNSVGRVIAKSLTTQSVGQFTTTTAVAEADTIAPSVAPLPGRMSVGGPIAIVPPSPASRSGDGWSISIAPTPARRAAPSAGKSRIAAIEPEAGAATQPSEQGASAGLPGTKSGSVAIRPPVSQARSYVAPRPQRAAPARVRTTAKAKPRREARQRYHTRSVQKLFTNPLGSM